MNSIGSSFNKILYLPVSRSGSSIENDNLHMFITPYNKTLVKELYFEVTEGETTQAYQVSDVDINSTPGVAYVSVDPTLLRSHEARPEKNESSSESEFYWLDGGDQ